MTRKPVIPRDQADVDIREAVQHYLDESAPKAALGLIDEIERAFKHIARNPATGSSRYAHELDLPGLRAWPLRRFPYLVFYVEREHDIDVWRVLHAQQDVPVWIVGHDE